MARIEWIKQRLDNWALWKDRERCGGLGFATQSVLLDVRSAGGYRESTMPIDEVDASKTDRAVESLKGGRLHLWQTLQHIYVAGLGIKETARRAGRAESTVKAQLEQADHALSAWFGEQAELAERAKKGVCQHRLS